MRTGSDTVAPSGPDRSLAAAVRRAAGAVGANAVDPRPAHAVRVIEILARERGSSRTARRPPDR